MKIISLLTDNFRGLAFFALGALLASLALVVSWELLHYSSSPEFCMSCHEMRIVGEQGWMNSPHFHNDKGIVAGCGDCHVPPESELGHMLWVKTRDGVKDIWVHYMGVHESEKMAWEELERSARAKIQDSSCLSCHAHLTAQGLPIKALLAHREYMRYRQSGMKKRCVECHQQEFHQAFKEYLFGKHTAGQAGREKNNDT